MTKQSSYLNSANLQDIMQGINTTQNWQFFISFSRNGLLNKCARVKGT